MFFIVFVPAALFGAAYFWRLWLLHQPSPRRHAEAFDGVVYPVGEAAVAERHCDSPRATVIGMHGFAEDMRYFTRHYADADIQLITLTSCGYHVPIDEPRYQAADWIQDPDEPEDTIEYDAEVLIQALENLPRSDSVRVHGHSRGGAVVIEAAARRPDLFEATEVVLEAPVLPGGRAYREVTATELWMLPFLMPLWRYQPINTRNRGVWGSLDDERKRELIEGIPFNARTADTLVRNLESIAAWMEERDASVYRHLRRGTILIPQRDKVLDAGAMERSARAADNLDVKAVADCSHFVLFDRPQAIPPLPA